MCDKSELLSTKREREREEQKEKERETMRKSVEGNRGTERGGEALEGGEGKIEEGL